MMTQYDLFTYSRNLVFLFCLAMFPHCTLQIKSSFFVPGVTVHEFYSHATDVHKRFIDIKDTACHESYSLRVCSGNDNRQFEVKIAAFTPLEFKTRTCGHFEKITNGSASNLLALRKMPESRNIVNVGVFAGTEVCWQMVFEGMKTVVNVGEVGHSECESDVACATKSTCFLISC